jgi:hypothetical protein
MASDGPDGPGTGSGGGGAFSSDTIATIAAVISVATALASAVTSYRQLLIVSGLIAFPILVWRTVELNRRENLDWLLIVSLAVVLVAGFGLGRQLIVRAGDRAAVTTGYRNELPLLQIDGTAETRVIEMGVDPGGYAISAKFYVDDATSLRGHQLLCTLHAGGDLDESAFYVERGRPAAVFLGVAHEFRGAERSIILTCRGASSGEQSAVKFRFIKILAVRVATSSWSNQPL